MPAFVIGLTRVMRVEVEATDIQSAIKAAQYIHEKDGSWEEIRDELGFRIGEIELLEHNAFDVTS